MAYYILRDKKIYPVGIEECNQWIEESLITVKNGSFAHDRWVKRTPVGKYLVSTVFLFIDHNFHLSEDRTPILFETMIIQESGEFLDYQTRCATYDQAIEQHEEAILYVKEIGEKET